MRWKAEAAKEDGTAGPVQRTVPKSNEPPLLILMRDYFRGVGRGAAAARIGAVLVYRLAGTWRRHAIGRSAAAIAAWRSALEI